MNDRISSAVNSAMTWLVVTVLGGIAYLIRRVFTNQKQIELLQADLTVTRCTALSIRLWG